MNLNRGVSYYNGSVYQGSEKVYTMNSNSFAVNDNVDNKDKYAKREYTGVDAQFNVMSATGMTQIRGEYLLACNRGHRLQMTV